MDIGDRKRKAAHQEEEEEEKKIEKFYELIKGMREARDRLMKGSEFFQGNNKRKKIIDTVAFEGEKKTSKTTLVAPWKPSFQREDFLGDDDDDQHQQVKFKVPSRVTTFGTPSTSQINKTSSSAKEDLDLRLSLQLPSRS
ncbi:hypothetical protein UlMin_030813 [Ulmus minor]